MLDLGISVGLEHLGIRSRTIAYCEREAYAASQLLALMETECLDAAPIWPDLTTFPAREFHGVVDLVCGGFPCQPHSVAGKREGVEDERWIWDDIERIIRDTGAWCVVFENVRGLLSSGGMGPVLASLSRLGFTVEWTVISAGEVGASHRRERVIIVAYAEHDARSAQWRAGQGRRGNKGPHHAAGAGRPSESVLADAECHGGGERRPEQPGRSEAESPGAGMGGAAVLADGDGGRPEQPVGDQRESGRWAADGRAELADARHERAWPEQQITICWRCGAANDCLCGEGLADASSSGRPSAGELRAGRGQPGLSGTSAAMVDATSPRLSWREDAGANHSDASPDRCRGAQPSRGCEHLAIADDEGLSRGGKP